VERISNRYKIRRSHKRNLASAKFTTLWLATLVALCFSAGCSSSSSSLKGGQFDALLNGSYTYEISGSAFGLSSGNGAYERAGTFVADGQGHITGGSDDLVQGAQPVTNPVTGSYAVANDGTGSMFLTIGSTQWQWAFTLTSSSKLTLVEFDSFATGTGGAFLQDAAAIKASPQGSFVFRIQSFQANNAAQSAVSSVGGVNISSGNISGQEDVVRDGTLGSFNLTGSLTTPDTTGKGSFSLTDSGGFASTFFYYIIDSNTLNLLETDSTSTGQVNFGTGRLRTQTGMPFSNSILNQPLAFFSTGNTQTSVFAAVSIGVLAPDGNGKITAGSYDSVVAGVAISASDLTGTYSMGSNGRATMALNSQATGSITQVVWVVDSSLAFYLSTGPSGTQEGTLNQQQTPPFSNGSLNGQFAFSMYGYDNRNPPLIDRVGVGSFDGTKNLILTNYFVNRDGSRNQTSATTSTYTVSPNGRVTTSIDGISNNIVMYVISDTAAYLISEDPNTQVAGGITQQTLQ